MVWLAINLDRYRVTYYIYKREVKLFHNQISSFKLPDRYTSVKCINPLALIWLNWLFLMSRWWSWSNWLHVGSKESVRLISRISLIFDRLSKISPFLGDDSSFSWVQIVNLDSDVDVIWRYSSAYKNNLYYCHFHKKCRYRIS